MKVITIANLKGGIGKTTTCQAMGEGLKLHGYKVLMIDLDQQANLTTATSNEEAEPNAYSMLTQEAKIKECIRNDFIASASYLADAERDLNKKGVKGNFVLKEALKELNGIYDYVVIDTPPNINIITINALSCSDAVIIPNEANAFSVNGLERIIGEIKDIKQYYNQSLLNVGILLIKYNPRSNLNALELENIKAMAEAENIGVYETMIRNNIALAEAQAMGQSIYSYAPRSNGAKDYKSLVNEFLEKTNKQ